MSKPVPVKVQAPLSSNARHAPALIYSEGRRCMEEKPMTPELRQAMASSPKVFMHGTWDQKSRTWTLDLSKLLPDQGW